MTRPRGHGKRVFTCSVAMSDPRVMSQYRKFVIMLSGDSATRPT